MRKPILVSLLALPVAFCQHAPETHVVSDYCQIARPIDWSSFDTRQTKQQIDSHNRAWVKLCRKAGAK